MVPRVGIEPTHPYGHQFLRLTRMPVPPPRHKNGRILFTFLKRFFGVLHERLNEIKEFHREDIFRRRALAQ